MARLSSLLAALTAAACLLRVSKAGLDLPISLILHTALALSLLWEAITARLWARRAQLSAALESRRYDVAVFIAASALLLLRQEPTDLASATLIGLGLTRMSLAVALRATTLVLAVHALIFQLTRPETAITALQRFHGWTGDPNDVALVALLAATPALLALSGAREPSRVALIDLSHVLIAGAVIVATQSRLALVAYTLFVALTAARLVRSHPRLGLTLVALLAGLVLMAPDRFWFRFFRLLEGHDLGMRPYLWSVGLEAFSESPWTGIGVGRFPELARGLAPHSLLLACIAEGGLLHTAVLAALAVTMARTAYLDRSRLDHSRLDRSRLDRSRLDHPRLDRSRLWAVAAFALSLAAPLDGRVLAIAVLAPLWMRPEGQAGPDPSR